MDRVLTILATWTFDPVLGLGLIVCACAYLQGLRILTMRGQSPPWPRRYTVCFFSGLALTWFVLLGPIGAYDDIFFWAHMTQHLAIMMVAAPLLVLGAPVLLLLRVSSRQFRRRRLVPILRSRAVAAVTHPVVGWLLFAGVLVGTHF
ncbi:MAG: cytochrome c oxidase assembly protein, partial [Pseudonocardiales bacterium]